MASNCTDSDKPPAYHNIMFGPSDNLDQLVDKLDSLENMVEKFRLSASTLEDEKIMLTKALTDVNEKSNRTALSAGHKEEIDSTVERLMMRVLSVDVQVNIPRTPAQEVAYGKVKGMIEELQNKVALELSECRKLLNSYLNSCCPEATGPIDEKFQAVLLCCTVDDQKRVRKYLSHCNESYTDLEKQWHEKLANISMKL